MLIVSSSEKGRGVLCDLLSGMQIAPLISASNGIECRRSFDEADYDVVLINAPLTDEFGHDLAVFTTEKTGAGVVLLVKAEMADEVASRVEEAGVFVVSKPLNRALLCGAVKLAFAAHRRLTGLQRQNNLLQQKIEDIRLVDRAKCALIQYRQYTESEAHKMIERQAMDTRKSRREVALDILRMYEGAL